MADYAKIDMLKEVQMRWANAKLIAAAPDLYAIAKELVEWEQDPDRYRGDLADLAQDARKILEKIEKED